MGAMPITCRTRAGAGAAVAALALVVPAATAAADGLPLPVEESAGGVLSSDGASRYLTVTIAGRTAVLSQNAASSVVRSRSDLRGRFGIPLVAYDSTAGGLSHDGQTLVLIRPRARFPRTETTFAVLSAPRLRVRKMVKLRGDFSYDALSPDGRSLFLINYLSADDPTKYRVRVYDLARDRLHPKAIVDPRESPDEMNGLPMARVTSPDGRWAYTLYDGAGGEPFIHALDTRDHKAVCIDLHGAAFKRGPTGFVLGMTIAEDGRRLVVRRMSAIVATVDTASFRVRTDAAAIAAAQPAVKAAATPDASDSGLLWPVLGLALLLAGSAALWFTRARRTARRGESELGIREFSG
jgi:hypothetical protein